MRGKTISITRQDADLIIAALQHLHKNSILNPTAYPEYAIASEQRIHQIIDRLSQLKESKSL